jgi:hypothetical protein
MSCVKISVLAELRKFQRGQKTKVSPAVLLMIVANDYVERYGPAKARKARRP